MGSSNLPSSISLSHSSDFEQKNGRNPCFSSDHRLSSHCQAPGWFWIPFIVVQSAPGAESAKHVHHFVGQHLHLPFRLQRGHTLPVHLYRLTHSLVRHSS